MKKIAVVGRRDITDIDTLACVVAYTEMLVKQGRNAVGVLQGMFNNSITEEVKTWKYKYTNECPIDIEEFILMDTSDINWLPECVDLNKVTEVYDHHSGYEDFWKKRPNTKVSIETIGSCATLVWEKIKGYELSPASINLLYTAVISNTLNFKSQVTTDRDVSAFMQMMLRTDLTQEWAEKYFLEQQKKATENVQETIKGDVKIIDFKNLNKTIAISQIELWNAQRFLENNEKIFNNTMKQYKADHWFSSSSNISEAKNYFYTTDYFAKDILQRSIGIAFTGDHAKSNQLFSRKDIVKAIRNLPITAKN